MNRFFRFCVVLSVLFFAFNKEMDAQYVQGGVRSEYVQNGKIVIGGVVLEAKDAEQVLGESLGKDYKGALRQKQIGKTLVRVSEAGLAAGAVMEVVYQVFDSANHDNDTFEQTVRMNRIGALGVLVFVPSLVGLITGGIMNSGSTKKVNLIRNAYNKSLSESQVSYSVGFSPNGLSLTFAF